MADRWLQLVTARRAMTHKPAFTLIEALVALGLASAGLATLHELANSAARANRAASDIMRLTVLAEARLAQAAVMGPGDFAGEEAGMAWRVHTEFAADAPLILSVNVETQAQSGRKLVLEGAAPLWKPAAAVPP